MLRHATKAMQHALPLNLSSFAIFLDLLYDRVYFFCLLKIKPGFSMNKRQSEEIFASCFCFNIEDFSRVICQPKQLLSVENKHEESFLSILWDQIMNKQSCFPLGDAKKLFTKYVNFNSGVLVMFLVS